MYWGALVKGDVYEMPGEAPTSAAVLERFEHDAGKRITIVNSGQSWASFDRPTMEAAIEAGAIPLVTMGLAPEVSLEEIADGDQDEEILSWARAAKEFGYPFLFRPWWEMNGSWYSWGRNPHFVAAWRHFHDLVVAAGATNVTWAWVVNTIWEEGGQMQGDPAPYYPGAEYVDWVGVDAYNWGRNPLQPDRWVRAEESIQPTLDVLEEIAPGKPVCVCESASTEIGAGGANEDKALWIHEMLGEYLPSRPQIKAYLWFNWNVEQGGYGSGGGHWDWPIESSPPAEAAFREGIQAETFLSVLPPLAPLAKVPMPVWPPAPQPTPTPALSPAPASEPESEDHVPPPEPRPPSNLVRFGVSKPGARPGSAILPIVAPGPGQLQLSGRDLRIRVLPSRRSARPPFSKWIEEAGELDLEVSAAGRKLRSLAARGSTKVNLTVRFTPEGGVARKATKEISLTAAG